MINKLKDKSLQQKFLMIFLMIQPVLDIYILFTDPVVDFFHFSPSTILRIISIGILFLMVLMNIKFNKKYSWFLVYGILLFIYLILHHINAIKFNANITSSFNYSTLSELFYIIRMLLPFILAFITYHIDLKKVQINKVILNFILIISLTIIITNILCISFQSYGNNGNFIKSNIFSWFFNSNQNYTNVDLSSRGFFNSANQIGSLLSILLPISIYILMDTKSKKAYFTVFSQILAAIMLGTRISSYSWLIISIIMYLVYLYFTFIKKNIKFDKKMSIYFAMIFIFMIIILQYSPIKIRKFSSDYKTSSEQSELFSKKDQELIDNELSNEENQELIDNELSNEKNQDLNTSMQQQILKFVKDNYKHYSINKIYIEEIYSYQNDPKFWYDVMKLPYDQRCDSRQIEKLLVDRIYSLNNNYNDKWYGMSFSRFRNANLYLEKDFIMHFYSLGIIGSCLLLYPYLFVIIIAGVVLIIKYKSKFNFDTICYCFSIGIMIICGYVSGSVFDQLIITLIGGFIVGLILKSLFKENLKDAKD